MMGAWWPLLNDVIAGVVAGLLLISGVAKVSDPHGFAGTIASYRLLPLAASIPAAWALILASLVVGVALLSGVAMVPAGIAAMILFLLFAGAMAINLLRGRRDLDCGCMPGKSERVSWLLVLWSCFSANLGSGIAFDAHAHDWWIRITAAFLGLSAMLLVLAWETLSKKPQLS